MRFSVKVMNNVYKLHLLKLKYICLINLVKKTTFYACIFTDLINDSIFKSFTLFMYQNKICCHANIAWKFSCDVYLKRKNKFWFFWRFFLSFKKKRKSIVQSLCRRNFWGQKIALGDVAFIVQNKLTVVLWHCSIIFFLALKKRKIIIQSLFGRNFWGYKIALGADAFLVQNKLIVVLWHCSIIFFLALKSNGKLFIILKF